MPFISYAQNREDVLLWRALKDVERGFYIDAGAADPVIDSVTHAFYEHGWHGINVEPDPSLFDRLVRERPRDINLRVGLAEQPGEGILHTVGVRTGLSTLSQDVVAMHAAAGLSTTSTPIPLMTLAEVCAAHSQAPIHFLKIDVEGSERGVLAGADFARWRPWIVVAEATQPNSQVPSYSGWEPLLICAAYRFALSDGLNRFYVADEQWQRLASAFRDPVCVFDDYITSREQAGWDRAFELEAAFAAKDAEAVRHIEQLRSDIAERHRHVDLLRRALAERDKTLMELQQDLARLQDDLTLFERTAADLRDALNACESEAAAASAHAEDLGQQLEQIRKSVAWRWTAPIRWISRRPH